MLLADVHAHLTHPRLIDRWQEVVARARAAGVDRIVVNGLHPADNQAVLAMAAQEPMIRPALGFYPVDAVLKTMREQGIEYPGDHPSVDPADAVQWLREHIDQAFAVGEIGLDGHWVPPALWPAQEQVFGDLVELALANDKPIIIHTRKREQRTFEILRELQATRVNWHCFGGRVSLARQIADHGHYLSIPANARRSESFTRMLQTLPRERVLLETDCPYLGPDKGIDNEPANVAKTVQYAAELWQTTEALVIEQVSRNYTALFNEHESP